MLNPIRCGVSYTIGVWAHPEGIVPVHSRSTKEREREMSKLESAKMRKNTKRTFDGVGCSLKAIKILTEVEN